MQTIAFQQVRLVPAWRPAPATYDRRPALAQQMLPPPPSASTKPAFIDSALVATVQDFTGALVTGLLAYGATYPGRQDVRPSRWAYVFLALTAGLVVKGFADLSRVRER